MRYPSIRGLGIRYLVASLLPITGAALVLYTAVQLVVAHATGTVPPPSRIVQAALDAEFAPQEDSAPSPGRK